MCLYGRMFYNPLSIYPVMGLLGQMVFLVLDPSGITTLSSTMIELIYTPTNRVEVLKKSRLYFKIWDKSFSPLVSTFPQQIITKTV